MDDARMKLFLQKGTSLIRLPMSSHTFVNKLKRSMYQASIWLQADRKTMNLPEPEDWGFKKTERNTLDFDWGTQQDVINAKNGTPLRIATVKQPVH